MSHESGKIEISGVDDRFIYMRYHRSKSEANRGRFFVCHRDDEAFWFDQLVPAEGSFVPRGVRFEALEEEPNASARSRGNGWGAGKGRVNGRRRKNRRARVRRSNASPFGTRRRR
jgi:hypothetical protein